MLKRSLISLALAIGMVSGVAQADIDKKTVDEVKALWEAQNKALDAHDVDGVMATFADSDDIMMMGTGPGEHWIGKEEIKDAYTHIMENFEAHTLKTECGEGKGASQGDVIWFTAVCTFTSGKDKSTVMNVSGVLLNQGGTCVFTPCTFPT